MDSVYNYHDIAITEMTHRGERLSGIWSRLLADRIIFLGAQVNDAIANFIIAQLLYLDSQDPEKDIFLYINTPGGSITAGMAIYDTMRHISADVATICVGQAASMGAVLLSAGAKGKRRALQNSVVLIHQPLGGISGQVSDIEIQAKEILRWKQVVNEALAEATGQPIERIAEDTDRDNPMTAVQALEYGLVDEVIRPGERPQNG